MYTVFWFSKEIGAKHASISYMNQKKTNLNLNDMDILLM